MLRSEQLVEGRMGWWMGAFSRGWVRLAVDETWPCSKARSSPMYEMDALSLACRDGDDAPRRELHNCSLHGTRRNECTSSCGWAGSGVTVAHVCCR